MNWKTDNLKYFFYLFNDDFINDEEDQKVSLFAEWKLPSVGFEVYGEMGLDDYTSNKKTNPFHTAIYTLGVKQKIPFFFDWDSELILEWNNFEMSQDFQFQWAYLGFYVHSHIIHGYTQKGQILGAGSGSFGNSQFLQYKVYYDKGFFKFKFHRYCPNNNSVYSLAIGFTPDRSSDYYQTWYANFETFFTYGIEASLFALNSLYISLEFDYTTIYNYNYIQHNNQDNIYISLSLKYSL